MRSILISVQPKWCAKIANNEKSIEVRKTQPKIELPFKCYIYCTASAPYLVYGDVFDGGSFSGRYTVTYGRSRREADEIWGILNGKVIGEFICNYVYQYSPGYSFTDTDSVNSLRILSALSASEIWNYSDMGKKNLFGWRISELKIYDEPKQLADLGVAKAPQSWCYVEEVD